LIYPKTVWPAVEGSFPEEERICLRAALLDRQPEQGKEKNLLNHLIIN